MSSSLLDWAKSAPNLASRALSFGFPRRRESDPRRTGSPSKRPMEVPPGHTPFSWCGGAKSVAAQPIGAFTDALAAKVPTPGGGAAAAATGSSLSLWDQRRLLVPPSRGRGTTLGSHRRRRLLLRRLLLTSTSRLLPVAGLLGAATGHFFSAQFLPKPPQLERDHGREEGAGRPAGPPPASQQAQPPQPVL